MKANAFDEKMKTLLVKKDYGNWPLPELKAGSFSESNYLTNKKFKY